MLLNQALPKATTSSDTNEIKSKMALAYEAASKIIENEQQAKNRKESTQKAGEIGDKAGEKFIKFTETKQEFNAKEAGNKDAIERKEKIGERNTKVRLGVGRWSITTAIHHDSNVQRNLTLAPTERWRTPTRWRCLLSSQSDRPSMRRNVARQSTILTPAMTLTTTMT